MQHSDLEDSTLQCSRCYAWNYPFASFCISCGQPFDDEWDDAAAPESTETNFAAARRETILSSAPTMRLRIPSSRLQWEAVIGLVILVLTLGYALYNVQHTNTQTDAYRAGIAAVQRKDWDAAVEQFARAGDHPDANNQKAQAQKQVAERNRLYDEGVQAANRQDWAASLSDLEAVQAIQPDYRGSASLLVSVQQQSLNHDLASIAYLIGDGGHAAPGIYVRDEHGRVSRLDKSDKASRVRASSPDGKALVYDRVSSEADYLPSSRHNTIVGDAFTRFTQERILVLALLGADGYIKAVPLPGLNVNGTGVFTKKGLWWFSKQYDLSSYAEQVYYVSDYLSPAPSVKQILGTMRSIGEVAAVDPPRSRIVIAKLPNGLVTGYWQTDIYLADADGSHERKLQTVMSRIIEMSVSADGQWLLCTALENSGDALKSIWSLPLDGQATSRVLYMKALGGSVTNVSLSAFLAPSDGHAKALVSSTVMDTSHLAIYDLETGDATVLSGVNDGQSAPNVSSFSHDGRYLMTVWPRTSGGAGLSLVAPLSRPQFRSRISLQASDPQAVEAQFSPRDNYVIARVEDEDSAQLDQGSTQEIYSSAISAGGALGQPKLLATAYLPYDKTLPTLAMPSGGSLFACVNTARQLYAVFYDGTNGTLVASNVEAVWSLDAAP